MVNTVDIIVSVVIGLVILVVSFYLFTMYCHPQQKGFGNALFPKILVIISQALAWGQVLLLPLDLSINMNSPQSSFQIVYYVFYPIIFFMAAFLNPWAMFFYESDQSDTMGKRLCWSFLFAFIVAAIWSAYVFISYIWLGVYQVSGNEFRLAVPIYIFLGTSLIGWILLAFNGGIGLVYLPFDLLRMFVRRPKPLTTEEAFNKKQQLQNSSSDLITAGEKLKQKAQQVQRYEGGWIGKKRTQAKFNSLLQDYKKKINKLEEQHQQFDSQVKIQKTHPVVHIAALIGGIFATIVTIFWAIQILGTMILKNSQPLFLFMDDWLMKLSRGNASFVATLLYGIFILYIQVCIVKGNTIFGIRIPFIVKLHPMMINKTYMNSLLFNCNLMLLASLSTSFLALWAFPTYLQPTYLSRLFNQAFVNQPLFGSLYGKRIPMILMQIIILLSLLWRVGGIIWRKYCGKGKDKKQTTKN